MAGIGAGCIIYQSLGIVSQVYTIQQLLGYAQLAEEIQTNYIKLRSSGNYPTLRK
uniref:Uncharacterized protein n=1 Tax=Arundo donax TaxID=35708 RepID=A0A0A9DP71_ARUDO